MKRQKEINLLEPEALGKGCYSGKEHNASTFLTEFLPANKPDNVLNRQVGLITCSDLPPALLDEQVDYIKQMTRNEPGKKSG